MIIDGKKVLQVVDKGTRFSAVRFLENKSRITMWKTLIERSVEIYTRLPNRILVDQGSNPGPSFVHMAHLREVKLKKLNSNLKTVLR